MIFNETNSPATQPRQRNCTQNEIRGQANFKECTGWFLDYSNADVAERFFDIRFDTLDTDCVCFAGVGVRRRHWLRSRLPAPRASLRRLRQEVEDLVHGVVVPADLLGVRRAVQHGAVRALAPGAHGCDQPGNQHLEQDSDSIREFNESLNALAIDT